LKPDAGASFGFEMFLVGDNVLGVTIALGAGEHDGPDRLSRSAASGAGDTGYRDGHIGVAGVERPLGHCPSGGDADRAECLHNFAADSEVTNFRSIRVGYISRFKYVGSTRNFGQSGADEAASAAFRHRDPATRCAIGSDDFSGMFDKLLAQ